MDQRLLDLKRAADAGDDEAWQTYLREVRRSKGIPKGARLRVLYVGAPFVGKTTIVGGLLETAPRPLTDFAIVAIEGERIVGFRTEDESGFEVDTLTVSGNSFDSRLFNTALLMQTDAVVYVFGGTQDVEGQTHHYAVLVQTLQDLELTDMPVQLAWNRRQELDDRRTKDAFLKGIGQTSFQTCSAPDHQSLAKVQRVAIEAAESLYLANVEARLEARTRRLERVEELLPQSRSFHCTYSPLPLQEVAALARCPDLYTDLKPLGDGCSEARIRTGPPLSGLRNLFNRLFGRT